MKYNQIGKSGIISSNLTLGTMIFGESSLRSVSEKEAIKMIDYFIDLGGNHIDTADVYAGGSSERIIGKGIKGKRDNLILSTKIRFRTSDDLNSEGLSRIHIIAGVDESLKRLNVDYIDMLYLHCWDPITPIEETLRALEDIVRTGKVRYIGISNFKAWQFMKAQGLCDQFLMNRFIAGQYQYSLVKRDVEYEFFDLFESEGVGMFAWGPLGGGFLTGKYTKNNPNNGRIASTSKEAEESWERRNTKQNWKIIDFIKDLAVKYNSSPTQISIAWVLSKKVISSVILGARAMNQLEDNMKCNLIQLSESDIYALNEISKLPELYPYRMIQEYGNRKI